MRPAALPLALLVACASMDRQPIPTTREGPWAAARDRHTRSGKVYDRLDDRLFATATYQALEVREARAERLAEWKSMTAPEQERLLAEERSQAEAWEEFLVAFYTSDRLADDLSSSRSVWRVALVVPGAGEMLPASRPEMVRPDATLGGLYPYLSHFDSVYRVRFPRWKGERPLAEIPFTLEFAGALGKLELRFNQPEARQ